MTDHEYRVVSTSSHGYTLLKLADKSLSIHRPRQKLSYKAMDIMVGDYVKLDNDGFILSREERINSLSRPRLANVDTIYILSSLKSPNFDSYLLNKFLTVLNASFIHCSIIFTKADLLNQEEIENAKEILSYYTSLTFQSYLVNCHDAHAFDFPQLLKDLNSSTSAFVGQTGVGKSSLLNSIDPNYTRQVDSMQVTSGRGRHTTTQVTLLPYKNDSYLFDTPGFSKLELQGFKSRQVAHFFPGFESLSLKCRFQDCLHTDSAIDCAVKEQIGITISKAAYADYLRLIETEVCDE